MIIIRSALSAAIVPHGFLSVETSLMHASCGRGHLFRFFSNHVVGSENDSFHQGGAGGHDGDAGGDITPALRRLLTSGINIVRLEIINDSARHRGHAGMAGRKGGNSHFIITIVSDDFAGMTRLARHRHVYGLLASFMPKPIHALNLFCHTMAEADALPSRSA